MVKVMDWAGEMGRSWAARVEAMHRQLVPVADLGMALFAPRPGERILDLGCGGGDTARRLAEAVGTSGRVTGVDISPELLEIARATTAGLDQVDFIEADAQTHAFARGSYDGLFSRFGCMFFDDPPVAFANLRKALVPGSRALFLVYTPIADNAWAAVPAAVATEVMGPPEPAAPGAPGPFGWSDPAIFEPILAEGGFGDIAWSPHDLVLEMGAGDDPDPAVRAANLAMVLGSVARRLADAEEGVAEAIYPRMIDAFRPYVSDGWARMPARIWSVTARA